MKISQLKINITQMIGKILPVVWTAIMLLLLTQLSPLANAAPKAYKYDQSKQAAVNSQQQAEPAVPTLPPVPTATFTPTSSTPTRTPAPTPTVTATPELPLSAKYRLFIPVIRR